MFLSTNITLLSLPGIPILTLDLALSLYFIVLFFFKGKKVQNAKCRFPFRIPFVFLVFCWTLSAIFGVAGFNAEISVWIKKVVDEILFMWMLWEVFETKEDFHIIVKVLSIVFLISAIYGLFEIATLSNPLTEYEETLNHDPDKVIIWSYAESGRGYRINSIFEHAIGAGLNWGLYISTALYFVINKKKIGIRKPLTIFIVVLSLICLVMTRSRTPLIFLIVAVLICFDFRRRGTYGLVIVSALLVLFILPRIAPNSFTLITSVFDTTLTSTVGGSSALVRLDQLQAASQLLQISPIVGLGAKYTNVISNVAVSRLLGGESIWFSVLPSYGAVGIIAYIILMIYSLYFIPKTFKSREVFIICLAYWVASTVSSTPGFLEYVYYLVIFYFIKCSAYYKNQNDGIYGLYFQKMRIHFRKKKRKSMRRSEFKIIGVKSI